MLNRIETAYLHATSHIQDRCSQYEKTELNEKNINAYGNFIILWVWSEKLNTERN